MCGETCTELGLPLHRFKCVRGPTFTAVFAPGPGLAPDALLDPVKEVLDAVKCTPSDLFVCADVVVPDCTIVSAPTDAGDVVLGPEDVALKAAEAQEKAAEVSKQVGIVRRTLDEGKWLQFAHARKLDTESRRAKRKSDAVQEHDLFGFGNRFANLEVCENCLQPGILLVCRTCPRSFCVPEVRDCSQLSALPSSDFWQCGLCEKAVSLSALKAHADILEHNAVAAAAFAAEDERRLAAKAAAAERRRLEKEDQNRRLFTNPTPVKRTDPDARRERAKEAEERRRKRQRRGSASGSGADAEHGGAASGFGSADGATSGADGGSASGADGAMRCAGVAGASADTVAVAKSSVTDDAKQKAGSVGADSIGLEEMPEKDDEAPALEKAAPAQQPLAAPLAAAAAAEEAPSLDRLRLTLSVQRKTLVERVAAIRLLEQQLAAEKEARDAAAASVRNAEAELDAAETRKKRREAAAAALAAAAAETAKAAELQRVAAEATAQFHAARASAEAATASAAALAAAEAC